MFRIKLQALVTLNVKILQLIFLMWLLLFAGTCANMFCKVKRPPYPQKPQARRYLLLITNMTTKIGFQISDGKIICAKNLWFFPELSVVLNF